MLFQTKTKQPPSIVKRVTLWYAGLISILILIIMLLVFGVSGSVSSHNLKLKLIDEVTEMSFDIDDFESYDDGIYYLLYDQSNQLIRGEAPEGFDTDLPFSQEDLQTVSYQNKEYAYYDVAVAGTSQWLRAVRLTSGMSEDMRTFLAVLGIGLPVFLVAVVSGGYLILKRAFYPIAHMVATARQMTNQKDYSKRLTAELQSSELLELSETLNAMLDSIEDSLEREKQFNHDVSHELRTPLAVILAESDYGQHYAENLEEAKESYRTISRQGRKMKALIEQILELSRAEHLQTISRQNIKLDELVREQVEAYQLLAQQKELQLSLDIEDNITVAGDSLLLVRLIDNLVSNALKYARTTVGIVVRKNSQGAELLIWDDGIGIAKEHQEQIWHRFFQVDSSRKQVEDSNSGLGLALVRRIADLHGARIILDSEINQGTRFSLIFQK